MLKIFCCFGLFGRGERKGEVDGAFLGNAGFK
jgi:hypothetical protein